MLRFSREEALLEVAEFIAILCTTLFTGAAIYVTLVEHPARMACGTELAEPNGGLVTSGQPECKLPLP
jgi:hypothetical protein